MIFYVAVDGDDSGRQLSNALAQNEDHANVLVGSISTAMADISDWAKEADGSILFNGGDNLAFTITSDANLDDVMSFVDGARTIYQEHTGHTAAAGVGLSIKDACNALLVAKCTGKNKAVYWNESAAAVYDTTDKSRITNAVPESIRLAREDQVKRLLAKGYTQLRAQFMANRNFLYGKTDQLPGTTSAERFMLDGETSWREFVASAEQPSNQVVVGQKILFSDSEAASQMTLGIVRSIERSGMNVETITGRTTRIASDAEITPIPMIRGANGS